MSKKPTTVTLTKRVRDYARFVADGFTNDIRDSPDYIAERDALWEEMNKVERDAANTIIDAVLGDHL